MTRNQFIDILIANGYKRLDTIVKIDSRHKHGWEYEHRDCLYREFDETEVAFEVYNKRSPNVWLSIRQHDAVLHSDVTDMLVINMFLAAFDADIIKYREHDYHIEPKYEWQY